MSLGALSGTRLGEQLSVQPTGGVKGFLPDKIGSTNTSISNSNTGSSAVSSSYGGSSHNSSSKARYVRAATQLCS